MRVPIGYINTLVSNTICDGNSREPHINQQTDMAMTNSMNPYVPLSICVFVCSHIDLQNIYFCLNSNAVLHKGQIQEMRTDLSSKLKSSLPELLQIERIHYYKATINYSCFVLKLTSGAINFLILLRKTHQKRTVLNENKTI